MNSRDPASSPGDTKPSDPDPIAALPPLREVIAAHGLSARRGLGQHFLLDLNITNRIARAAGDLSRGTVIEIGPGPGGLTRALLQEGATSVIAIERDHRCIAALDSLVQAAAGRLRLVEGDALTLHPGGLGSAPRRVVANLPYNIATPLLIRWLTTDSDTPPPEDGAEGLASLTLMFQKEVAERLAAAPNTPAYGRLSVLVQWLASVRLLFHLPARAFTPPPKIASSVVAVTPVADRPEAPLIAAVERVTAAAFGQRRKMLRRSLRSLPTPGEDGVDALLQQTGLPPTARAEDLPVSAFVDLGHAFLAQTKN